MKDNSTDTKIMDLVIALLDIAPRTYYAWKKEKRPIIAFLETYFTASELSEYVETGHMQRLEISKTEETQEYQLFKDFLEWQKQKNHH